MTDNTLATHQPNTLATHQPLAAHIKVFHPLTLILPVIICAVVFNSFNVARAQTGETKPATPPTAQRPPAPAKPQMPVADESASAAQQYFTDVELINQNGERMRLYSDLLKGKVVIINAFFATCQGSCLPMNQTLKKLQEAFKSRLGADLYIISISVDPEVDTPASLNAYAKKLNAAPGRFFLTGKKENVDWALYKLGQYVERRDDHTNIFIIGNERTGLWKKAFGLAQPEELIKIVESVLKDQPADKPTADKPAGGSGGKR